MIEDLRKNIELEKTIIRDMSSILAEINRNPSERGFYEPPLRALINQLKILNNSIPALLDESPVKKLTPEIKQVKAEEVVKLSYVSPVTNEKRYVTINKEDKKKFLEELQLSERGVLNIRKSKQNHEIGVKKPSQLSRISNLFFLRLSENLAKKTTSLADDLKKANINILTSTYISIAFFICLLVFIFSSAIFIGLLLINFELLLWFWSPLLATFIAATGFYFYPSAEKSSVQKRISQELPFATIHMAAIAGSNVEPTKIFKIISMSSEYPTVSVEIKKVINQVEIYGYDLVNALKNSARQTPNAKLGELFSGLATNISSGGDLKSYLEKKSDNFLLDYQLERQRYRTLAETFMDVYISILITAPLILMMMFIIMNVTGLSIGLSLSALLILSVGLVVLLNVIFLVVLQLKQPEN